jgi:hypothetical protein
METARLPHDVRFPDLFHEEATQAQKDCHANFLLLILRFNLS